LRKLNGLSVALCPSSNAPPTAGKVPSDVTCSTVWVTCSSTTKFSSSTRGTVNSGAQVCTHAPISATGTTALAPASFAGSPVCRRCLARRPRQAQCLAHRTAGPVPSSAGVRCRTPAPVYQYTMSGFSEKKRLGMSILHGGRRTTRYVSSYPYALDRSGALLGPT